MAASTLATFLRDRRTRLDPATFGLAGRRRTPGLRREEVAQRANISPTWYTWLEQGRGGAPSADVLNRIARAMLLTEAEREHLFMLGLGRPPEARYTSIDGVSPRLQRFIDRHRARDAVDDGRVRDRGPVHDRAVRPPAARARRDDGLRRRRIGRARHEARRPRQLGEIDFLLGVHDFHRQGALRRVAGRQIAQRAPELWAELLANRDKARLQARAGKRASDSHWAQVGAARSVVGVIDQ